MLAAASPIRIEQLEKLAELRKSGALTDEEFEQQKRRVLGEH
ncbi:MAG: SHOCT domain-containing protein [Solirubrobacterales bacterium]|nr:SHOCT domain-containing protein [Solirubrobacterales bacterium]